MLGLPALSVVSVWSGRCLIYGDGITVNRLLPSWEWVSSPSPGTSISHLDKIALKLHCSEYLSPWVLVPSTSPAPGFTRCSADTAAPSWKTVNKRKLFYGADYPVRVEESGDGEEGYEISLLARARHCTHELTAGCLRKACTGLGLSAFNHGWGRDAQVQTPFTSTPS